MAFFGGTVGSVQTDLDDGMPFNFGSPIPGGSWGYTMLRVDGALRLPADTAIAGYFSGLSDRYWFLDFASAPIETILFYEVIGDAARLEWRLTNIDTAPHTIGLWSGLWLAMINEAGNVSGFNWTNPATTLIPGLQSRNGFVYSPGISPPLTERRFFRITDGSNYPQAGQFLFSQSFPYGLKIENGPLDPQVYDVQNHVAHVVADTQADELVVGNASYLLASPDRGATFPDVTFINPFDPTSTSSDIAFRTEPGYIQKYPDALLAAGQTRTILQYFHSVWSNANYRQPYAVVVDAPRLITYDPNNSANNFVSPNPSRFKVMLDNIQGFAQIQGGQDAFIDMTAVKVTVKFPKDSGLTFASGQGAVEVMEPFPDASGKIQLVEKAIKTIDRIPGQRFDSVEFSVVSDGLQNGSLPYTVATESTPGGTRFLTGTILATTTPRLILRNDSNLVSIPWTFADSSWTSILGLPSTAFTAYTWDPVQQGYVVSPSAERGRAAWILTNTDYGSWPLNPSALIPSDIDEGFHQIEVKAGWNLIGNPYPYPIQLAELTGASSANQLQSFTFEKLVKQGLMNGSAAFWDNDVQAYRFVSNGNGLLLPNKGYWLFVVSNDTFTLKYPAVFLPGVQNVSRAVDDWGSNNKWRLQLVAHSKKTLDDQNFVGAVPTATDALTNRAYKPPMAPRQTVDLSILETISGRPSRLAQSYTPQVGQHEWVVEVRSTEAGTVTVTWPNLTSLSTNRRFRLVDPATGASRDMRQVSGYSFDAPANSTRQLRVQTEPSAARSAVIGNVVVSRPTRGPGATVSITYSLSGDATTSVRVLSNSGREIYTVTRGRADRAGENTVTWSLRDNANRAVAPGVYRVEILAETVLGDRVRKVVPVTVIR
ncbi:MAG: hypothetical protein HYR64_00680 [Fimbriimonas ginsengisoli]|uniref:FlgD/Vpr Ig-like domain-containing protein n=1 Tax=Fimbriimonas ginsengisoli TaxID=1005039 RepID=A0A931PTM2_FIMGI|nr:hypothetical protein [Fimbriimonas ginsengisoli]